MNQPRPIQNLLGGSSKQQPHHLQQLAGSQQELQHQHNHHSLTSQQNQPLVNASQQTMLQFHHQTLHHNHHHHPYSTLHLQQAHQLDGAHLANQRPLMQQTLHQHQLHHPSNSQASANGLVHLHQQQHHHNNSQQQQYNMNSDYSSSTYHIYDQISDLIIIKQQRMERKRQLEQRRKVILIAFASTLLVSTASFLVFQLLFGGGPSATSQSSDAGQSRQIDATQHLISWPPAATHLSASPKDGLLPLKDAVLLSSPASDQLPCSGHGTVIHASDLTINAKLQCRCDAGYLGERCEFPAAGGAAYAQAYGLTMAQVKCMQMTDCSGHGFCNPHGRCQCYPAYFGAHCESRLHHSTYHQLEQLSQPAHTQEMAAASSALNQPSQQQQCRCSGNGQCLSPAGPCKCYPGFAGPNCQERDKCHGISCLNEGVCVAALGVCQCKFGFKGTGCETRDEESWQRLLNCSQHGHYDARQASCVCDAGFGGFDCSEERCDPNTYTQLDCSPNGLFDCRQNRCICQDGYSGSQCQIQQCSTQCLRNGQCIDGACVCQPGFYGKHCSLNGCPNKCSGRGQCVRVPQQTSGEFHQQVAEWRCQCQPGSLGDDCGILLERQCDDGLDNDHDGLVDCADSECCSDRACQNSTLCMKSPDPLDILMRKQPPPPTSSFFQRMQFLIEKYSSQTYSSLRDFNDSISTVSRYLDRASVVRGKVTYMRQGVTGVRVSVAGQSNIGMTLTRDGGYFDLLVNGGGAVTIEFRREPFATKQKIVRVPWNEIVLIDQIEFKLDSSSDPLEQVPSVSPEPDAPSCFAHNYKLMRPRISAQPKSWRTTHKSVSWDPNQQSRAVILRDSGMVQQDIQLPGSSSSQDLFNGADANQSAPVSLVYISSRANEFMSTISIQLTPPTGSGELKLPQELKAIHLRIVIEGNLFEQLFEPQMNLTYTYAWNRRNVYRQKSFGLSTASVSVGYEYFDCKHVIWNTKHVQLPGHDLSISDIGNQWNLNIHHRYNYRDSILQRGDGHNFNLKTDKQRVVQQVLGGNGQPRLALCENCDNGSGEQRLLKPQALVSAPDGSLYVADFNLIRRIEWSPTTGGPNKQQHSSLPASADPVIKTILELPSSRVPSKYSLALNLADQRLYMSDIDRHQIYLIREQQQQQPGELNETTGSPLYPSEESLLPVVGDGVRCQLDDGSNCGDRQSARLARLVAPKAFAFDLAGRMYIADGPNVRMVDTDGKIYTILGDYGLSQHTKYSCSGEAVPMHKFVPKSPQDLAFNPIDDTLFILDNNIVYKVTQDKRVQVVAGRLSHCDNNNPFDATKTTRKPKATEVQLLSAQSITFSQNGELFISEDDQTQQISRVLLVDLEEDSIGLFAGLPVDQAAVSNRGAGSIQGPTVDSVHQLEQLELGLDNNFNDKQRASNSLPLKSTQTTRATDYKFNSIAAIAVDQQGRLLVADKLQLKIFSVEPDIPQMNSAGEFELQSPDNPEELLVFNRFGHHLATRDISRGGAQRGSNKYTFFYTVNTSFGLLGSVSYASGNKISIYRDGPHHAVRMIETAYKGQCKLDISRSGQVLSISTIAPDMTKTSLSYHNEGGLLKQSKDSASGELFDFSYDEFGRATKIKHTSPRLPAPVECSLGPNLRKPTSSNSSYTSRHCSALIVSQ